MSTKLKLGAGNWATKAGSLLSYNDENGNFKPLPFNFTRSTGATRVNKDGLIEMVTNNKPRIDFSNDANGALLLEPERTNSLLQSNQFDTTWTTTNATVLGGQSGIYGSSDAWKLSENTVNSVHILLQNTISISNYTFSIYLKKGTKNKVMLFDGINNEGAKFNLETQSFHSYYTDPINYKIEILSDGWARYSINISNASSSFRVYMLDDNYNIAYGGNIENYIYIQYAQLEAGSYATSYIPTQGSAVTRVADACSKTGVSSLIGQTEGTIYLEANIQKRNEADFYVAISDGATLGAAIYAYQPSSGTLTVLIRKTGNPSDGVINVTTSNWTAGLNKLAIAYTSTTAEAFINGVSKGTTSFASLPAFTKLTIGSRPDSVGTLVGSGGYNQALLFNTRLTDAECIELTTI